MQISYRTSTEIDIENIIAFWNENSGWENNMDRNEFNLRFLSSPFGEPIIVIGIDNENNNLIALISFICLLSNINNKQTLVYRPYGAVLKESIRSKFGLSSILIKRHPIQVLYHLGAKEALKKGASIIYLLPDPRFLRILKTMPFRITNFPLYSRPIPSSDSVEMSKYQYIVNQLNPEDPTLINLWIGLNNLNPCYLIKNNSFFCWKIKLWHGNLKLYSVYENDKLMGVFSLQYKGGSQQWIIGDILTSEVKGSLKTLLDAACYIATSEFNKMDQILNNKYKISIMKTSSMTEALLNSGFKIDIYNFTLAIHILDKSISKSIAAPENWHIGAND